MKAVRFRERHGIYNPGDVAGFEDAEAAALIASGKAVDNKAAEAEAKTVAAEATPKKKRARKPRK